MPANDGPHRAASARSASFSLLPLAKSDPAAGAAATSAALAGAGLAATCLTPAGAACAVTAAGVRCGSICQAAALIATPASTPPASNGQRSGLCAAGSPAKTSSADFCRIARVTCGLFST